MSGLIQIDHSRCIKEQVNSMVSGHIAYLWDTRRASRAGVACDGEDEMEGVAVSSLVFVGTVTVTFEMRLTSS